MNEIIVYKPVLRKVEKYGISKPFYHLVNELKEDERHGNKIPRSKWPRNIYKSHKKLLDSTGNLWKDEIIHGHPGSHFLLVWWKHCYYKIYDLRTDTFNPAKSISG